MYVTSTLVITKLVGSGSLDGNEANEHEPWIVLMVEPNFVHAFITRLEEFGSDAISEATTAWI